MCDQRSYPTPIKGSPAHQDRKLQRAVLDSVIEYHPVQLTVSELIREIAADPMTFTARDGVSRAVFDLTGLGVLHRHDFLNREDSLVIPARAALHICELLEDEYIEDDR